MWNSVAAQQKNYIIINKDHCIKHCEQEHCQRHSRTETLSCKYSLPAHTCISTPNSSSIQVFHIQVMRKMFNIYRIVSYCHAQNNYDSFFSVAGRILPIRRRLGWPKYFRRWQKIGGFGYSAAATRSPLGDFHYQYQKWSLYTCIPLKGVGKGARLIDLYMTSF